MKQAEVNEEAKNFYNQVVQKSVEKIRNKDQPETHPELKFKSTKEEDYCSPPRVEEVPVEFEEGEVVSGAEEVEDREERRRRKGEDINGDTNVTDIEITAMKEK